MYYERSVLVSKSPLRRKKRKRSRSRNLRKREKSQKKILKRKEELPVVRKERTEAHSNQNFRLIGIEKIENSEIVKEEKKIGFLRNNCSRFLNVENQKKVFFMLEKEDMQNKPSKKINFPQKKSKKRNMAESLKKALMEDRDSIDIEEFLKNPKKNKKGSISKNILKAFQKAETPQASFETEKKELKDITNITKNNFLEKSGGKMRLEMMIKNTEIENFNTEMSDKDFEYSSVEYEKIVKFKSKSLQHQVKGGFEALRNEKASSSLEILKEDISEKSEIKLSTPFKITASKPKFDEIVEKGKSSLKAKERSVLNEPLSMFFSSIELKEAFKAPYPNCNFLKKI